MSWRPLQPSLGALPGPFPIPVPVPAAPAEPPAEPDSPREGRAAGVEAPPAEGADGAGQGGPQQGECHLLHSCAWAAARVLCEECAAALACCHLLPFIGDLGRLFVAEVKLAQAAQHGPRLLSGLPAAAVPRSAQPCIPSGPHATSAMLVCSQVLAELDKLKPKAGSSSSSALVRLSYGGAGTSSHAIQRFHA